MFVKYKKYVAFINIALVLNVCYDDADVNLFSSFRFSFEYP